MDIRISRLMMWIPEWPRNLTLYLVSPDAKQRERCYSRSGSGKDLETCTSDSADRIEVTHPFHPLSGQTFPIRQSSSTRDAQLVCCIAGGNSLRRLPRTWTSLRVTDDFERVSAGRALFRMDDLIALRSLVDRLLDSQ